MVTVGTGGSRSKFIKTKYPVDEGRTLGTTKLPDEQILIPEEESLNPEDHWGGI